MTINKAALSSALKELYAGQTIQNLVYDKAARPFLSMLKKNTGFSGSTMPLPVIYEDVAGRSATFATAQANVGASKITKFAIDVVADYAIAEITTDALLRSRNNSGAFLQGVKHLVDSAINRLSNDLEASLFGDGSGSLGTVTGGSTAATTLEDVDDVVNFWVGQTCVIALDADTAPQSGTLTVSAVDRDKGIVTFSAAPSTLSGGTTTADGYHIFNQGDYVSAGDRIKLSGLAAWLPSGTPAALFGVTRTTDRTRLAGVVYSGSSAAVEESLIGSAARLGREGGSMPDTALMSYTTFRRLVEELGSKVQRDQAAKGQGGFQSLQVYGPRGLIDCVPCTFCPSDRVYLLTSKTWQFVSMNEPVHIIDNDGSSVLRKAASDAMEVRVGSFSQLACNAPGANAVITL